METKIWGIIAQLPVLVAFIWWSIFYTRIWRDYLRERNGKLERALERIALVLDHLAYSGYHNAPSSPSSPSQPHEQ